MNLLRILVVSFLASYVAVGYAQGDTALRLRLQSIEARLPDVERLAALEDRVERLAQARGMPRGDEAGDGAAAGGGALFSLFQEVQALQEEMRQLRGEVEELRHLAEQGEQRQRDLYRDMDRRLQALEQGTGPAPSGRAPGGTSGDDDGQAEQAYLAAFAFLKAGEYGQAREAFQAFIERYPEGEYSDNAWYWLGEAHYVDRQYEPALAAFKRVVEDYPDSQKTPGAIYKTGVILDEQGQYQQAREQLRRVIEQYPDNEIVESARRRLQALDDGNGGNGDND